MYYAKHPALFDGRDIHIGIMDKIIDTIMADGTNPFHCFFVCLDFQSNPFDSFHSIVF
jgi:hypothetical protein